MSHRYFDRPPGRNPRLEDLPEWLQQRHLDWLGTIPTQPDRGFPFHMVGIQRGTFSFNPLFVDEPFVMSLSDREFGFMSRHFATMCHHANYPSTRYRDDWDRRLRRVMAPLVYDRDGRVCGHCRATDHLTIDHIVPLSRGGSNDLENLQVLCRSCNSVKGARVAPRPFPPRKSGRVDA